MNIENFILFAMSFICVIISVFQFKEKGIPLNNEYIWASKNDRDNMADSDKRPYFKQSAIVFLLLGLMCGFLGLAQQLRLNWLFIISNLLIVVVIVYAVCSSVYIAKNKNS